MGLFDLRRNALLWLVLALTPIPSYGQERAPTWNQALSGRGGVLPDSLLLGYAHCEVTSTLDSVTLVSSPDVEAPIGVRMAHSTEGQIFATPLFMPADIDTLSVGVMGYACHVDRPQGLLVSHRSGETLLYGEAIVWPAKPFVMVQNGAGGELKPLTMAADTAR